LLPPVRVTVSTSLPPTCSHRISTPTFLMPTFQQAVKHEPAAGDQQDLFKGGKAS
jgi:hypothetical protein